MVISEKHKYVFIEVPRTGTSAISEELCSVYDGQRILRKHSSYWNFLAKMRFEANKYTVLSCIRNPMDSIVSLWFKLRNKQKNPFKKSASLGMAIGDSYFKKQYKFSQVVENNFSDYFLKFYQWPYNDMSISHNAIDFIIRFENLQEDFDKWLSIMKIEKVRDVPHFNPTVERSKSFWHYYEKRTWQRAFHVFGPYFNNWGYKFPEYWGKANISYFHKFIWKSSSPFKRVAYFLFYLGKDG